MIKMVNTLKQECADEDNYPTVDEMREMMRKDISLSLYFQRVRHGWDNEKAKTKPPQYRKRSQVYNQFSDFELEYLITNFISHTDYVNRRRLGWSREEAIFVPKGIKRYQILNHKLYPVTRQELKEIYNNESTIDTYRARRFMGWTKDEAMTTPKRYKKKTFKIN